MENVKNESKSVKITEILKISTLYKRMLKKSKKFQNANFAFSSENCNALSDSKVQNFVLIDFNLHAKFVLIHDFNDNQ